MVHLITGVAGFIGSNLAERLLERSDTVIGIDNYHLGRKENISEHLNNPKFTFIEHDLSDIDQIDTLKVQLTNEKIDTIWHLAANSDIQAGIENNIVDLDLTFKTTFTANEICKSSLADTFIFASTSAIYGNLDGKLREDSSPLNPISNYGAMKLASEALLGTSIEQGLNRAFIFRFPNVVGIPATHGVIYDFVNKLHHNPDILHVLGDGSQKKCYMHSSELIDALLHCVEVINQNGLHCFNVGPLDSGITVKSIAKKVVAKVSPSAEINFGDGNKGWIGDVPSFEFDISKLQKHGWNPNLSSEEAVEKAITEISDYLS